MFRIAMVSALLSLTGCAASQTISAGPATERAALKLKQQQGSGLAILNYDDSAVEPAALRSCLTTTVVDMMNDDEVHAVLFAKEDALGVASAQVLNIAMRVTSQATDRCRKEI